MMVKTSKDRERLSHTFIDFYHHREKIQETFNERNEAE